MVLQPFPLCCLQLKWIARREVGVPSKERERERRLLGVRDPRPDERQEQQGRSTDER
jgi:hypothetical protein